MTERSPSLHEKILRLRNRFLEMLPERISVAQAVLSDLRSGETTLEKVQELHRHLHSLKGTAASFGLEDLSNIAARGESVLSIHRNETAPVLSQQTLTYLEQCLARLASVASLLSSGGQHPGGPLMPPDFTQAKPAAVVEPTEKKPKLVYLCDDDQSHGDHLASQLSCFGYNAIYFNKPEALTAALADQKPDALVMDIIFPDGPLRGVDTVKNLRNGLTSGVPTIFLSARHDFDARLRAVQAGGVAYFNKPVNVLKLAETLDTLASQATPDPLRVVVVDDEPATASYHALVLQDAGMLVHTVNDPRKLLEVLADFNTDLVLMDMYMPDCSGLELARVIRQMPNYLSLPILYLSSETDTQKQLLAMRVGADGFLTKPISAIDLISAVTLRAERMRALRLLMVRDSLTGLFNHTTILHFLTTALASARRRDVQLCFAMLDVDRFKAVNDTYGHPSGDQVLVTLSRILQQRLRTNDLVGRYGGEEFAVILADTGPEGAREIMDALREDFSRVLFRSGETEFCVTFSCGIAAFPQHDSAETLCQTADTALYDAKRNGRNQVICA